MTTRGRPSRPVALVGKSGAVIDRLNRWLGANLCWLYLVAVIVTAYEVVMRYIFNAPTDWAFELTILLCAVCYLLAGGWVTQKEAHIAITSLPQLAPPRLRWWLRLFANLVGLAATAGLAWAAWRPGCARSRSSSEPAAPGTRRHPRSSSRSSSWRRCSSFCSF